MRVNACTHVHRERETDILSFTLSAKNPPKMLHCSSNGLTMVFTAACRTPRSNDSEKRLVSHVRASALQREVTRATVATIQETESNFPKALYEKVILFAKKKMQRWLRTGSVIERSDILELRCPMINQNTSGEGAAIAEVADYRRSTTLGTVNQCSDNRLYYNSANS